MLVVRSQAHPIVVVDFPREEWMATKATTETVGQRIARLRRERGVTQVELANELGIAQAYLSRFEHDRRRLYADLVVQIAEILDVSTDEILGRSPSPRRALGSLRLTKRLERIRDLPERDQQAIVRMIDAFLDRLPEPAPAGRNGGGQRRAASKAKPSRPRAKRAGGSGGKRPRRSRQGR